MKVGLFYGTTTGTTEMAAESIKEKLGSLLSTYTYITENAANDMAECDVLILGIPTWDIGEMQSDWWAFLPKLESMDFSGKRIALFGLGDQFGYPGTFLDAMGDLWKKIEERGGELIGQWPTEGYEFSSPKPVANGKFVGLALDPVNQDDKTEDRIRAWVEQLKSELHVEAAA